MLSSAPPPTPPSPPPPPCLAGLNTADVIYPAFALYQYYQPELMKRMIIPLLEYAMNFTSQPYPLPWAPHHLGFWPVADLPYTNQENMPLEETSYFILNIALIAQQQGGDVTWLTPYWPAITQWIDFLVTLLPFPGTQLSTDDFDGQLVSAAGGGGGGGGSGRRYQPRYAQPLPHPARASRSSSCAVQRHEPGDQGRGRHRRLRLPQRAVHGQHERLDLLLQPGACRAAPPPALRSAEPAALPLHHSPPPPAPLPAPPPHRPRTTPTRWWTTRGYRTAPPPTS